jgi:hypothetical protein
MITLQFIGGEGIGAWLIGWMSAGHLSHVDAVMSDGRLLGARSDRCRTADGKAWIPAGVQIRPATYIGQPRIVVRFDVAATAQQETIFWDFLNKQLRRPYDFEAILGFVFNRDWRETDSWICSELICAAIEKAGIIPPLYLAANRITPVAAALALSMRTAGITLIA